VFKTTAQKPTMITYTVLAGM